MPEPQPSIVRSADISTVGEKDPFADPPSQPLVEQNSWQHEVFTIPNAVTLFRGAMAPWGYKAMRDNPGEQWKNVGKVFATDLEGNIGRLEKVPHIGQFLAKIGCRTSIYGAQGDVVSDVAFGTSVLAGGMKGGSIPWCLGKWMFYQRAYKSGVTLGAKAEGNTLKVSNAGAAGEFLGAISIPLFGAAEAQTETWKRAAVKGTAVVLATGNLVLSSIASAGYTQDAGLVELPESVDRFVTRVDRFVGKFLPGGSRKKTQQAEAEVIPARPITNQLLD